MKKSLATSASEKTVTEGDSLVDRDQALRTRSEVPGVNLEGTNTTNDQGLKPEGQPKETVWAWNFGLLLGMGLLALIVGPVLAGLYYYNSNRITAELVSRATIAKDSKDSESEMRWLIRYLAISPNDVSSQVRLAVVADESVNSPQTLDRARILLTRALASSPNAEDSRDLRLRLIRRLIQLGGGWNSESRRQLSELKLPPGDPVGLDLFSQAAFAEVRDGLWRPAQISKKSKESDYWAWLTEQPAGEVAKLASMANPDSILLSEQLLEAYVIRPELFDIPGKQANPDEFKPEVQRLIDQLKNRAEPQAQWLAFSFSRSAGLEFPSEIRQDFIQKAVRRIEDFLQEVDSTPEDTKSSAPSVTSSKSVATKSPYAPELKWDARLVLGGAIEFVSEGKELESRSCFDVLRRVPQSLVEPEILETLYINAGDLEWRTGNRQVAWDIWSEGLTKLPSLLTTQLKELVAATKVEQATEAEARAALDAFEKSIDEVSLALRGSSRLANDEKSRDQLQLQLDQFSWRLQVLRGQLALKNGQVAESVLSLKSAVATRIELPPIRRAEAYRLLSNAYSQQELWDLAAASMDEAASLSPNDPNLRLASAELWKRSGGLERNLEQVKTIDNGSFEAGLLLAEAQLSELLSLPVSRRNPDQFIRSFTVAEDRLNSLVPESESRKLAWRLEILRLSMPPKPDAPEVSDPLAKLVELSKLDPANVELQAAVAMRLSYVGRGEEARESLTRCIEALPKDDSASIAMIEMVRGRINLFEENTEEAVRNFTSAIQLSGKSNQDIARNAAVTLESFGRLNEAIAILESIPVADRSVATNVRLGRLVLNQLSAASEKTASDKFDSLVSRVKEQEGANGSNWKWLTASRMLQQIRKGERDIKELREINTLQEEVLTARPRWALALALAAEVAAIQRKTDRAIQLYQSAIKEGDDRISTVFALVQLLNQSGALAEAEAQFERISGFSESIGQVAAMEVELAERKGEWANALALSRENANRYATDPGAWLVLAQVLATQARRDADNKDALLKEALAATEKANELTEGRNRDIWLSLIRLRSQMDGEAGVRETLGKLSLSKLDDKLKFLTLAAGFVSIKDNAEARRILDEAVAKLPLDADIHLASAELSEVEKNPSATIRALETAFKVAPNRDDVRQKLALALVVNSQSDVPWSRVTDLIGSVSPNISESSRLQYALVVALKGGPDRIEEARTILQELMNSQDPAVADNSARLLVTILRQRYFDAVSKKNEADSRRLAADVRRIYDFLTKRNSPDAADLYRYADFLLLAGFRSDVSEIADALSKAAPSSSAALSIRLRVARESSDPKQLDGLVQDWITTAGGSEAAVALAGRTLSDLGFTAQSVDYLRQAYQKDPSQLRGLVVGLARSGEINEAAMLCVDRIRSEPSPDIVVLLADLVTSGISSTTFDPSVESVLSESQVKFETNPQVVEAIANLRLAQAKYTEAIALYELVEKMEPNRVLTLNNMAMTFSEIPGREKEGIARIQRAIDLYGRAAELLDTLGVLQIKSGKFDDAIRTLQEATSLSSDQRLLFHLLLAYRSKGNKSEVARIWAQLDAKELAKLVLTPSEREVLMQLEKEMLPTSSSPK